MSRIRQVGGTYIKKVGGDYTMYASETINFKAAQTITEEGVEKGEFYTNQPEMPPTVSPYFEDGFWGDEYGNKITKVKIGETAYFYILTQNIPEGEEVEFTLYDWDDTLNFDDFISIYYADGDKKGQPFTKAVVRDLGRIRIQLNLTEGLMSFVEEDAGDEIELYFECRYKSEVVDLPKSTDDYLIVTEKEEVITVLIELPHSQTEGKLGQKGLAGHSAIMIGDEFYDFGPQPGKPFYSEGRPWWDSMAEDGNLTKNDILFILENSDIRSDWGIIGKVYLIDIIMKESEKRKVENWWKERYKNIGNYSVFPFLGEQCTTAVRISLEESTAVFDLISNDLLSIKYPTDFTQKPEGLLNLLINHGHHTHGENKGEKLIISKEFEEIKDED